MNFFNFKASDTPGDENAPEAKASLASRINVEASAAAAPAAEAPEAAASFTRSKARF